MAPCADHILSAALTYVDASTRSDPVPAMFESEAQAFEVLRAVLLHEAHEALSVASDSKSAVQPVNVDTETPGVHADDGEVAWRERAAVPRMRYDRHDAASASAAAASAAAASAVIPRARPRSRRRRLPSCRSVRPSRRRRARRAGQTEQARAARAEETPEARKARLAEARLKREQRKAAKAEAGPPPPVSSEEAAAKEAASEARKERRREAAASAVDEETLTISDSTVNALIHGETRGRRRIARGEGGAELRFFENPLAFHRHLYGLTRAALPRVLADAVLRARESDALRLVVGPPGTGKTRELVRRIREAPAGARILVRADERRRGEPLRPAAGSRPWRRRGARHASAARPSGNARHHQ